MSKQDYQQQLYLVPSPPANSLRVVNSVCFNVFFSRDITKINVSLLTLQEHVACTNEPSRQWSKNA